MTVKLDRAARVKAQWAKERPELDGLVMALLGRMQELSQTISDQHLAPLMQDHGLKYGEFDVIATLRRAGEPYALTPTQLYDATMVTSGAMTGRIDKLEKAGLVERRRDSEDRRSVTVALTDKGRKLIDEMMPKHVANEQEVLAGLSRSEQEQLESLLGKLLASLPVPYLQRRD